MRAIFYRRNVILSLLSALLVLNAGCGGGPKLVPVKGKVTFRDKPVVPGSVYFVPISPESGLEKAGGLLNLDGSFTLRTHPHGNGAMVGSYKLVLSLGGGFPELANYTREDKSITVEVPAGGKEDFDFAFK